MWTKKPISRVLNNSEQKDKSIMNQTMDADFGNSSSVLLSTRHHPTNINHVLK